MVAGIIYYLLAPPLHKLVLTGIVTTDEVIVSSQIQGQLQQLLVREGDTVTNGELLAVVQPQEQQANLAFFSSSQTQAVSQLVQSKADLENAGLNFERIKGLYSNNVESVEAYDRARTTYEAAEASVEAFNSQIQAARAQEQKAQVQLGYTQIRSPLTALWTRARRCRAKW